MNAITARYQSVRRTLTLEKNEPEMCADLRRFIIIKPNISFVRRCAIYRSSTHINHCQIILLNRITAFLPWRRQPVANPSNSCQQLYRERIIDLAAQPAHVDIDNV